MWPLAGKKNLWILSAIKVGDALVGTQIVLNGADRDRRDYPYVVFVTLSYQGHILPTDSEMERFQEFDDELSKILKECSALHVGVITWKGIRDWICYAKDGQIAANRIYTVLSAYSPKIEVNHDPTWGEYRSFVAMSKG